MNKVWKNISLNNVSIEYVLKQSKGRNLKMQILHENNVAYLQVNKPKFVMQYFVDKYLQSKTDWILEKLELVQNRINKNIENGKDVENLSGKDLKKRYVQDKEIARVLVNDKLEYWKSFYKTNFDINLVWNKVAIKNTQTRWGSCSSKKNLNFSFKIIYLSNEEQDYLIVHELCHLLEMNHGKNFWNLVSLGIPQYLKLKNKLRKWKE